MAYFRCTTGGSGKGNTLVVTCADELAGATITCTNGTKTYTKTCPSTSPYEVTFYGLEAGTWTVSATVSGMTYTTTVVVADIEALLGGFNWRIWVNKAQYLDSSDYDSLDEVLADELAVRELCLEHACVDYMASIATANADVETIINTDLFAKWVNNSDYALDFLHANEIIADYMDDADKYGYGEWVITDDTTTPPTWGPKGNVPVMTANNAPYGEASSTPVHQTFYAYKAFNKTVGAWGTDTYWAINGNGYLQYRFTNPVCVKKMDVAQIFYQDNGCSSCELLASNDGTTFTPLGSFTLSQEAKTTPNYDSFNIDNDNYYLYYRINVTRASGKSYAGISNLQFYGRELKVSVPKMDTNTTPYGEVIFSGEQDGAGTAWYQFDRSTSTGSTMTPLSNHESYIGYDFGNPVVVRGHARCLYRKYNTFYATPMKVQGSNDKNTWDTVYEYTNPTQMTDQETHYYWYDNAKAYRYWRLFADDYYSSYNNAYYGISGYILQFFCEDYSEKEFEAGTTKKWLYDHGVELETLTKTANAYSDGNTQVAPGFENDDILLDTQAASQTCMVGTETLIDFTNHNLLRILFRWELYTSTPNAQLYVLSAKNINDFISNISLGGILGNYPQCGLDVSSVTSGYIACRVYGQSGRQAYTIQELWLE